MASDRDGGGGPLDPLCALRRAAVRDGVRCQRDAADSLLAAVDRSEERRRRARLSSHYAAVRAVDGVETMHPDDEPPVDPLYDGVGRTFRVLRDLDDRATESATAAVETAAAVSERLTRRALAPGLGLTRLS